MKSSTVTINTENVKESIELLKLSCELGGFPILKVKTDVDDLGDDAKTLNQLSRLQRVLIKENKHYYRKSILHLLAEGHTLDEDQLSLLKGFLESGSLQKINLRQRDGNMKLPLVLAIENGNIEFI